MGEEVGVIRDIELLEGGVIFECFEGEIMILHHEGKLF